MSIDGARLGWTGPTPVVAGREEAVKDVVLVRGDLEARGSGPPSAAAASPARTLPKFPVGTTNSASARSAAGSPSQAWR